MSKHILSISEVEQLPPSPPVKVFLLVFYSCDLFYNFFFFQIFLKILNSLNFDLSNQNVDFSLAAAFIIFFIVSDYLKFMNHDVFDLSIINFLFIYLFVFDFFICYLFLLFLSFQTFE